MDTLGALLDGVASRIGDREALAYAPRERVTARLTWGALREASREAARKLLNLGIRKGSRIGLLCSNRLEWLPIAFGILRVGGVLVPVPTLWKCDELAYGLAHADVQTLITLPGFLAHDYVASVNEILPELRQAPPGHLYATAAPFLRRVVLLDGAAPGADRWGAVPVATDDGFLDACEAAVSPTDPATVFFTSGTTAQAKAAVHSHRALTVAAAEVSECLGLTADDAWWGHLPLFWSGGFVLGALASAAAGARIVLQERVDAGGALELLETEGCTVMSGWHQARPLTEHPDFPRRKLRLRKGTGANHPLATTLFGRGHAAVTNYGMTETATCITSTRWDDPEAVRVETFGRPLGAAEVRIVQSETGCEVAAGTIGEIHVRGPTLMDGYHRVLRAETFDAAGFFATGDLGYVDAAGRLHFTARLKDVIKTAGVNVAAREVEEALAGHPAVSSAYVIGVPDSERGESVAAFIVARPATAPTSDDLKAFCAQRLASYKVPRHVFIVRDEDLPVTASGKVEKQALRREAERRVKGLG